MTTALLDIARGYVAAGLSVIRVRADGTKAPADAKWRAFSERRATGDELTSWFNDDTCYGLGITGGPASGNLAVLDFEIWGAYDRWFHTLPDASRELTRKCPLSQPPGGGAHLYARLPDSVPGVVLSRRWVDGKARTLIEVRGDGHQVLAPGCPAECHPSGRTYEWLRRGWVDGGPWEPVSWETWFDWLEAAAALNEVERPAEAPRPADTRERAPRTGDSPGEDFNRRGTWEETGLFDLAGWSWHRELGDDRGFVRRPDKKAAAGLSGTVGLVNARKGGHPLFYCFTANGGPFEHQKSYSRFRTFAIVQHRGDFTAAARALGQKGYGEQPRAASKPAAEYSKNYSTQNGQGEAVAGDAPPETPNPPNAPTDPPSGPNGTKPPLPIVYYADIEPALDAADFVEDLLIDGAMTVIYGESGCGKTFFTLDLALHVAAGMPWQGREVSQRGVLYLALEGSHGIRNRVAAFKKANLVNAAEFPFAIVPVSINLLDPDGDVLRVIEAAKTAAEKLGVPVGFIVVDTLSRAIAGGNENASEDMGALVRNIDFIRQALPAHVAAVHHSGKDGARGARGHSLLRAATDTEIEVSREYGTKTSVAKVTKQRELELGAEFPFELLSVELGVNRRGKKVCSCVVRFQDPSTTRTQTHEDRERLKDRQLREREQERDDEDNQDVLRAVDEEIKASVVPAASESSIKKRAKCSKARVLEALSRLLESGQLVRTGAFKKPSGQGAMITIEGGYKRPIKDQSDERL